MVQEKDDTRSFYARAKRLSGVTALWKAAPGALQKVEEPGEGGCDLLFPALSGRAGPGGTEGRGEAPQVAGFSWLSSAKKAAE